MKIIGNPVGTTLPKPDWSQTDPTKGDYIKNKPEIPSKLSQLTNDSGFAKTDEVADKNHKHEYNTIKNRPFYDSRKTNEKVLAKSVMVTRPDTSTKTFTVYVSLDECLNEEQIPINGDSVRFVFIDSSNANNGIPIGTITWGVETSCYRDFNATEYKFRGQYIEKTKAEVLENNVVKYSVTYVYNAQISDTLMKFPTEVRMYVTGGELKQIDEKFIPEHEHDEYAKKSDIPEEADLTGYATENFVKEYSQPRGNYLTEHQDLSDYAKKTEIPTVPVQSVNSKTGAVQLSASDVGADADGTAQTKVLEHNTSGESHNDIRLLIEGLTTRLNVALNSTDTDLDQMAEIVAYIKSNKSLIDGITTNKVSVSDIIDNLTTSVSNKPLSAKQGVELKKLIDAVQIALNGIKVPTKTSELTNDSGFLTQHQDLSGYAKKTDIPSVPTKTSQLTNDSGYLTSVPSEYVTDSELNTKGYAKQSDVNAIGGVEVTSGDPTRENTVLTIDPNGEEINIYTAQEIDLMMSQLSGGETVIPDYYVTEDELAAKNYLTSIPSEYVTDSELNAKGYAKQSDVDKIADYSNVSYGTCSTAAATAEKVVTVDNENWELKVGAVVMVNFTTSNSASSVKLNVNGSGAYPIWYNNAEYTSTGTAYTGYANRVIGYMFNGTHWVWIMQSYDSNTTYTNVKLGHGYATCSTAETTTAKVGTLSSYTLTVGGIVAVKFTNAVPANATLNINSKGAKNIFYRGAKIVANVIKAGDIVTFIYDGTQYQLLSIDRWQSDIDSKQPKGNYLTSIPSEYITETELEAKGYATQTVVNELSEEIVDYGISVKMYGAVGDGVHDDTQAFEDALAENNYVYVPNGSYLIKRTLDLTNEKSLVGNDGQGATLVYDGKDTDSVVLIGRSSIFRNINVTVWKAEYKGVVFDTDNTKIASSTFGLNSRVEHSTVKFNVRSTEARLIRIIVDSGTDANNMPALTGLCFQTYNDIYVDGHPYGCGIEMTLVQGRPFTEETNAGFPWITHIDFDDIYLGSPYTGIKAGVENTSGSEYFERISIGHILFNNVYTQYYYGTSVKTRYFLDANHFEAYLTKCMAWDYHNLGLKGEKCNIIGEGVNLSLNDCEMVFGVDFLESCDFIAETESGFTVEDSPSYFTNKYFKGTFLRNGYDTVDAKIDTKLASEYIGNIAEDKVNEILYSGYTNVLEDPRTQLKDKLAWSGSRQDWVERTDIEFGVSTLIIPAVKGGNIIRWTPQTTTISTAYNGMYLFNEDFIGVVYLGEATKLLFTDGDDTYLMVDNPDGYPYVSIPFPGIADLSPETMFMTINREITENMGTSYTEHLKESVINPAIEKKFEGVKIPSKTSELTNDSGFLTQHQSLTAYAKKTELPTKTSQLTNDSGFITAKDIPEAQVPDLSGYAVKSSAETWTFTLADGSTVTKKVVLA